MECVGVRGGHIGHLLAHLLRVEIGLAIDVRVLGVHVHHSAHRALPLP